MTCLPFYEPLATLRAGFLPPSIRFITPLIKATTSFPPLVYDEANSERLLHEQAILCARLARLLRRSLHGLAWEELRFGDRSRLERALSGLGQDIPLVWLIQGQKAPGEEPADAQIISAAKKMKSTGN